MKQNVKKVISIALACTFLACIALVGTPETTVKAVGEPVQVYLSSENTPGDATWFTAPKTLTYKLSRQADLQVITPNGGSGTNITVNPAIQYQDILGIGSSLEESSVYNIARMSTTKRDEVLRQLVDPVNGIGMNLMRICLGTADFTGRTFYSYDDMPAGQTDVNLANFSIQKDINYNIVATLQQALAINPNLKIFASPWSPPGWMKTSDSLIRGQMKSEYIDLLAKYYRMAIQAYAAQGIPIYAMTVQNEPMLEIDYPSCSMTSDQERLLSIALKSEFAANGINTKVWVFDHNFSDAVSYVTPILSDASGYAAVDGVAFHDYAGDPSIMTTVHNTYPAKDMHMTERMLWGCSGADRIAQFFRNWSKSYNAWVTMLDSNIKPEQWTGVPGPTIMIQDASNVDNYWNTGEVYMFGQFSKFVQRGARRIDSNYGATNTVTNVAFLNPDNTVVVVVINQTAASKTLNILCEGGQITASLPAHTVGTYKWTRSGAPLPTPTPIPTPTSTPTPTPATIPSQIEAENYSSMSGVATETCTDTGGGLDVGWIETGDWMDYSVNVATAGNYTVDYRVASTGTTGVIQLKSGSNVLATTTVPNTGGWQNWTTVSATVSLSAGVQTLRLYANGGGFNVNWLKFTTSGGSTPTPTPTPTVGPTPTPGANSVWYQNFEASNGFSAGTSATTTIYSDTANAGGTKCVKLTFSVTGDPGTSAQCVKITPQVGTSIDATQYGYFNFFIKDTQGANTHKVTMIDTSNAQWSAWIGTMSVQNQWKKITVDMSTVTGINKAAIKEIRIGEWNAGTYYFDDTYFSKTSTDGIPIF